MVLDWITVILLIVMGLFLIIVELIFMPGTTLVGLLGFALSVAGIWIGYSTLGTPAGHIILGAAVLVGVSAFFYSFRFDTWTRFALKDRNMARVNDQHLHALQEGQTGVAISALRPMGTALFGDRQQEVETNGEFINANTPIQIVKITLNKIVVKELS